MSAEGPDKDSEGHLPKETETGVEVHHPSAEYPDVFESGGAGDGPCRPEHKRSIGDHSLESISSGKCLKIRIPFVWIWY